LCVGHREICIQVEIEVDIEYKKEVAVETSLCFAKRDRVRGQHGVSNGVKSSFSRKSKMFECYKMVAFVLFAQNVWKVDL
jgi:hypothetical protein